MRRSLTLAVLVVVAIAAGLLLGGIRGQPVRRAIPERPNVIIILTNDQRWDTLWAMPKVRRWLVRRGVTFTNAFVANPSCCPSRASILTGLYSHSTGVFRNRPPHGGFESFNDSSTLATWLHDAGYHTALIGEYLNGYRKASYVPRGWDQWFAFSGRSNRATKAYYDYEISADGSSLDFGHEPKDYSTDVLAVEATRVVSTVEQPFFLLFAPAAPHPPAVPPDRYANAFDNLRPWRPASFNEPDVSDKLAWLRAQDPLGPSDQRELSRFRKDQYRSLLAVDDAVGMVMGALRRAGRLGNTLVIFLSDNGYLWGEHRLDGKGVPYEESIRVPFVVRYDPAGRARQSAEGMVLNIDIAPTIVELSGVHAPRMDGQSLVPLLKGAGAWSRNDFLIEHLGRGVPTWCAMRTRRLLYAVYEREGRELYFLREDPFELDNRINDIRRALVERLDARLRVLCNPQPPGFKLRSW